MYVISVDALCPGSICEALRGVRVTIIVLGVERDELGRPASLDAMPRQEYPDFFRRAWDVVEAFKQKSEHLVNSYEQ